MGCASSHPATIDPENPKLAPAYAKRAPQGSLPLAHKLSASGRTGSGPPSRTNSGPSRLGSGSFNGSDPGAALDRAARNAAAAAVKQAKRENSTLQARLATMQERLAEADGGRIQALKALQEAWKRIDDLEQRCAAARAEGQHTRGSSERAQRESHTQSARLEAQLQGVKAERAALEAQRKAEAADSRKALAEIDFLQAQLANTQEEIMAGGGDRSGALRGARAQMAELKGQLAAAHAELQANAAAVAEAASAQSQVDWLHARLQSSLEEVQVGDEALQQALSESREETAALQGGLAAAQQDAVLREAAHQEALDAMQDQLEHFLELAHAEQMEAYAEVQRWASAAQAAQQALSKAGLPLPPQPAPPLPPQPDAGGSPSGSDGLREAHGPSAASRAPSASGRQGGRR